MWTPITTSDALPPIGTRETPTLEFKAQPSDDAFELAKDIAALANTSGGTILVGAAGKDTLGRYLPLEEKAACKASSDYELAVRDRCSPTPLTELAHVPHAGGLIVAVNVHPFPGQPVGVRIFKSEVKCGPHAKEVEDVFWYPRRAVTHTKAILPEQLAMFVDAQARRVAAFLQQEVGASAILFSTRNRSATNWVAPATIRAVSIFENSITLDVSNEGGTGAVTLPLDAIESVCKTADECHIFIRGKIQEMMWASDAPAALKKMKLFYNALG